LRSVLTSAETLFDSTRDLDSGLRTVGRATGPTRDTDVLRQRLLRSLVEEPPGPSLLKLRERLDHELEGQRRRHWLQLVDYLDSPGFDELARGLDGFADLTPWTAAAGEPAALVLPRILDLQRRRFDSMMHRVAEQSPSLELDEALHDLRKRVKAVRTCATPSRQHWADLPRRCAKQCVVFRPPLVT
jgi:CHAD domain-containing protein